MREKDSNQTNSALRQGGTRMGRREFVALVSAGLFGAACGGSRLEPTPVSKPAQISILATPTTAPTVAPTYSPAISRESYEAYAEAVIKSIINPDYLGTYGFEVNKDAPPQRWPVENFASYQSYFTIGHFSASDIHASFDGPRTDKESLMIESRIDLKVRPTYNPTTRKLLPPADFFRPYVNPNDVSEQFPYKFLPNEELRQQLAYSVFNVPEGMVLRIRNHYDVLEGSYINLEDGSKTRIAVTADGLLYQHKEKEYWQAEALNEVVRKWVEPGALKSNWDYIKLISDRDAEVKRWTLETFVSSAKTAITTFHKKDFELVETVIEGDIDPRMANRVLKNAEQKGPIEWAFAVFKINPMDSIVVTDPEGNVKITSRPRPDGFQSTLEVGKQGHYQFKITEATRGL